MPKRQEPTSALLAGRRALEGLAGVDLLEDLVWNEDARLWTLSCRLIIDVQPEGLISGTTGWYVLINPTYPWGQIEFFPAKDGGITQTFPHQRYNALGTPGQPWRLGNICVQTGLRGVGRHGCDYEPYDIHRRLRWHFQRALVWLCDASRGQLVRAGEPFEIPDFPTFLSRGAVVFSESKDSFTYWWEIPERSGYVDLLFFTQPTKRILVKAFRSRNGIVLYTPEWGKTLKETAGDIHTGIWIRLAQPPTLLPWQAPVNWRELCKACVANGIDLTTMLPPLLQPLRDGKPHIVLLGFPMPAKEGELPCQFHWQAMMLPVLSSRKQSAGFRQNEAGYWRRDYAVALRPDAQTAWIKSENWHNDQIATRGRLPQSLRTQSVGLLGAGALGAVLAELLVRAGVHKLTIVDQDQLEAGNLVRHPLCLPDLDASKAEALAKRLNHATPHASVEFMNARFPWCNEEEQENIRHCNLLIDCTGSDEVLHSLSTFSWTGSKVFVSLSLGLGARRLYCFTVRDTSFPHKAFVRMIQPWLARDLVENEGQELPREGVGCWNPVFPARADDVWMMAAIAVKDIEHSVVSGLSEPSLRVYEQTYRDGNFTGVQQVTP